MASVMARWRWFWQGFFSAFCIFPREQNMAEVDRYLADVEERVRKQLAAKSGEGSDSMKGEK